MPRQNRVTPFGEIVATPARGTFMGNRGGCLHDDQGNLTGRRWVSRAWITCLLEFRGRRRTVMSPGRYTELFFLDEASALAAGHRPCAECRRGDFNRFKAAWLRGNPDRGLDAPVAVGEIDRQLHDERVGPRRQKVTFEAPLASLPDGAFVTLDDSPGEACLLWRGKLHRWTPEGYRDVRTPSNVFNARLLTPRSTVEAIRAAYEPHLHPTATGDC